MLMDGIFAAVPTPFYPDERVYYRKLEANLARYSRSLVTGMLVLGSTGEAAHLTDTESAEVLRVAAAATAPEKVLLAGVGRESVRATLELAEVAAECRYDAVLIRPPSFYASQHTPQAAAHYFRTVADRSPLPVLLYHNPKFVSVDLPVEVVAELAHHPNIIGIKDTSGSVERIRALVEATRGIKPRTAIVTPLFAPVTARMMAPKTAAESALVTIGGISAAVPDAIDANSAAPLKTRSKQIGFQVLCGTASILLESLDAGAVGGILAFAAFAPEATQEIYIAWKDHDMKMATTKQQRIATVNRRIVGELGIGALKYACDFDGYFGGHPRSPLTAPTTEVKAEIEHLLADIRC
jgi:dihydrodipicolinate synthase/N-acetylneuraminate lyase